MKNCKTAKRLPKKAIFLKIAKNRNFNDNFSNFKQTGIPSVFLPTHGSCRLWTAVGPLNSFLHKLNLNYWLIESDIFCDLSLWVYPIYQIDQHIHFYQSSVNETSRFGWELCKVRQWLQLTTVCVAPMRNTVTHLNVSSTAAFPTLHQQLHHLLRTNGNFWRMIVVKLTQMSQIHVDIIFTQRQIADNG